MSNNIDAFIKILDNSPVKYEIDHWADEDGQQTLSFIIKDLNDKEIHITFDPHSDRLIDFWHDQLECK